MNIIFGETTEGRMIRDNNYSIYQRIVNMLEMEGGVISGFEPNRFVEREVEDLFDEYKKNETDDEQDVADILADLKECTELPAEEILPSAENKVRLKVLVDCYDYTLFEEIQEKAAEFDAKKAKIAAYELTTKSRYSDIVLAGLVLFSITKLKADDPEREVIKNLGLCGKFRGYAATAAKTAFNEEDYQQLLFEWASELGAACPSEIVGEIKADTAEKKHWLLCYGCRFDLSNSWVGEFCLENSDLRKRLEEGDLSDIEFNGMCEIFWRMHTLWEDEEMTHIKDPVGVTVRALDEIYNRGFETNGRWLELFCKIKWHFAVLCKNKPADYYTEDMQKVVEHADKLLKEFGIDEYLVKLLKENDYVAEKLREYLEH